MSKSDKREIAQLIRSRRIMAVIGIAVLLLLFVLLIIGVRSAVAKKGENPGRATEVSTAGEQNRRGDATQDWRLMLVNGDNPLPEDYSCEVTELSNGQSVDSRVYPYVKKMLHDMRKQGLDPVICSSYRTRQKQVRLFNNKVEKYKSDGFGEEEAAVKASLWVAPPGTSEHEAGLSLDIVDASYQLLDEKQSDTQVAKWLYENCASYGFIVRYPTGKSEITKVNFEPWHYRFVGEENAKKIMASGLCLEEYCR